MSKIQMNKQGLIFLDFDGVLNDPYWLATVWPIRRKRNVKFEFDLSRLEILRRICDRTDAQLVLASSWSFRPGLVEYFESIGFKVAGLLRPHSNRGEAIKNFLGYSTANWIILDDEKSDYDKEQLEHLVFTGTKVVDRWTKANLVMAKCLIGLDERHIDEALKLLETK